LNNLNKGDPVLGYNIIVAPNLFGHNGSPSFRYIYIEVLDVKAGVKKAIILLSYRTDFKVLKDALAHLGPYQTLTKVWCTDPGGKNIVSLPVTIQI
jgi:hypothetical protein